MGRVEQAGRQEGTRRRPTNHRPASPTNTRLTPPPPPQLFHTHTPTHPPTLCIRALTLDPPPLRALDLPGRVAARPKGPPRGVVRVVVRRDVLAKGVVRRDPLCDGVVVVVVVEGGGGQSERCVLPRRQAGGRDACMRAGRKAGGRDGRRGRVMNDDSPAPTVLELLGDHHHQRQKELRVDELLPLSCIERPSWVSQSVHISIVPPIHPRPDCMYYISSSSSSSSSRKYNG